MTSSTLLNLTAMRNSAGVATAFLRSMANEDRLMLLCQLTQGEKCVSELEALTGILQPTLSQQLGVLRNEGLVDTRREGKYIYYAITDSRVLSMLGALQDTFCRTKKNKA